MNSNFQKWLQKLILNERKILNKILIKFQIYLTNINFYLKVLFSLLKVLIKDLLYSIGLLDSSLFEDIQEIYRRFKSYLLNLFIIYSIWNNIKVNNKISLQYIYKWMYIIDIKIKLISSFNEKKFLFKYYFFILFILISYKRL